MLSESEKKAGKILELKNNKIGYALGGGAARGLSHIGVLKVLDEYNVSPDLIVGTSMGALIGALYASGLKARDIEKVVLQMDWRRLIFLADMTLPLSGVIQGKRVISLLKSILGDITFSQLKYDFACVSTDITTGEQVVFHDGSLIDAVRASISIPGIFTPVEIDERYFVDGGLVNEVPVSVCRVMGAEYVIGVNVLPEPSKLMCNPKKGKSYPACELIRLGTVKEQNEMVKGSNENPAKGLSINDIQNKINGLLKNGESDEPSREGGTQVPEHNQRTKKLKMKAPSLIDILTQTLIIAEYRVAMDNLKDADMVISPEVGEIGFWQFTKSAQAIAAGEKAAREVVQRDRLTSNLHNLSDKKKTTEIEYAGE